MTKQEANVLSLGIRTWYSYFEVCSLMSIATHLISVCLRRASRIPPSKGASKRLPQHQWEDKAGH
jgi:hypothetical protein